MDITLYYFKIPFWRAEVSRLALFMGDIPFTDYRIEKQEYDIFKKSGKLPNNIIAPFKQLPVLEVDGKIFSQTGTIARFCGKLSGLYPTNNDYESASIDQIIEASQDINFMVTLSNRDKDPKKMKLSREILATKHLPKMFQFLENLIDKNKKSPWFVSDNITIADLDCLVVNSLGEMPIYYKLSDIVILGGSFVNLGGHNPLEPANYHCSILTGPSIFNWQSIYNEMIYNKCCILCKTANELGYNIESILNNNKLANELRINAFNYSNKKQNIINDVLNNINPYIEGIKNA